MARGSAFGIGLALAGALILTPDVVFMRWSGMSAAQMLGWRGLCMALVFVLAWGLTSRTRKSDLAALAGGAAPLVVLCQAGNATLFPLGIALAPVTPVLLGVATVPVWSALLARVLHGERASAATWTAIALVLAGIALAVTDHGDAALDAGALTGAACGLGVALALAVNFVTLRHNPQVPLLLAIGLGAFIAGCAGWIFAGPARMTQGNVPAILFTALLILPTAFFLLSLASRYTAAANVSLLMLLETVLAPLWVWLALGEAPTGRMLAGGAVVVVTLAIYVLRPRRRERLASVPPLPTTPPETTTPGP
ncbi:DMT family transporter [Maliponia aquimaris]|uniref:EamA-like transporter family protein n=1 Tax=Maliponia aquimaris TaxID=1673631 RepID=A0A238L067_9RHOB|nr:DMT family transporter [Maliponia aquimaris]SMX48484.1 EamA-like transporter family protein [Maliponia aquimaris]